MKRIFLTGASSGIGLAIARELTARGHEVWGTSRDLTRLPQLERLHPVRLDLADADALERAFLDAQTEAGGAFDVVINNAGHGQFGAAEFLAAETLREQFQVLVFGHIRLMQLALGGMRARRSGLIINVTSLASRLPIPFMACYNAAKGAMASFTMTTQLELSGSGVTLIDLQPADISTGFNDAVVKTDPQENAYTEALAKTWRAADHNLRNAPPPELVARAVAKIIDAPNPPPRITVGDFFQSKIAPLLARLLPQRLQLWGIRGYYKL
jgi:short-subunit dehydrogenase